MNQYPQLDFSITIAQQNGFVPAPPQIIRGTFMQVELPRNLGGGYYYISTAPINNLGHYAWLYRSNRAAHHQRWCIYFGEGRGAPGPLLNVFTGYRFIERGVVVPNTRPRRYSGSVNPIDSVWVSTFDENNGLISVTLTPPQQQRQQQLPPPPQQRQQQLPPPPQQQQQQLGGNSTILDTIARRIARAQRGLDNAEVILRERNDADVAEGRRLIAELSRPGGNLQTTLDRVNNELMTVIVGRIRGRIRRLFDAQYNLAIQSMARQPQEIQTNRQLMINRVDLLFRTIANPDGFVHYYEFERWVNGLPPQYSNFIMNAIDWYPIFPITSVNSMLNLNQFLVMLEHLDFMIAAIDGNIPPITEYVLNLNPARMGGGVALPPGPRPEAPGPRPALHGSSRIHPNVDYTFRQLASAFNLSEAGNDRLLRRINDGRRNPHVLNQVVHIIGKNARDPKGGVMALIKYIKETSESRVPAGALKLDAITSASRLKELIRRARTDRELLQLLRSIPNPNEVDDEYDAMGRRLVRLYTEGEDAAVREKRTLLCWFLIYGMKHDHEFSNDLPITFSVADGTEEIDFSGYMAWVISYGFMMDQNPDIQKQWIEDFMRESLEAYKWDGEDLNIDTISIQQLRGKKAELERGGVGGSISCGKGIVERTLYAISRVLSREDDLRGPQERESEASANDRRVKNITSWHQEYFNSDRGDGPMTEDAFRKFVQGKIAEATQPSDTPAKWEASLGEYIASGVNANGSNDLFFGGKRIRKTSKRQRTKRKGKSSRKF